MIHVCDLPQVLPQLPDKRTGGKSLRPKRSSRGNDFKLKYKTEICRGWEQGECTFGEQCAFAHGPWELREKQATEGKKTKPCKSFSALGYCMMGTKCQFIHNLSAILTRDSEAVEEAAAPSPEGEPTHQNKARRLRVFLELEAKASL